MQPEQLPGPSWKPGAGWPGQSSHACPTQAYCLTWSLSPPTASTLAPALPHFIIYIIIVFVLLSRTIISQSKSTLQSCKGPLMPRRVSTPFPPGNGNSSHPPNPSAWCCDASPRPWDPWQHIVMALQAGWVGGWCTGASGCGGNGNGVVIAMEVGAAVAV